MIKRSRGRPRKFNHEQAMVAAVDVFSRKGFTGASLDDLADAMQMTRPSIYNAYGDKEGVYRQALLSFIGHMREAMSEHVVPEPDLAKALEMAYLTALGVYFSAEPPRGCFLFCTAPVEAITHPEIFDDLNELMHEIDGLFEMKFREAQARGSYSRDVDVKSVARVAQGVLHTLAIRSRAGESLATLKKLVRTAVPMLCEYGQ